MFRGQYFESTCPSERERRVIELVAQGLKNRDVASQIGTTEHVIKNYLRTIYDKLGLWNRVELALWYEARRHEGLIHQGPNFAAEQLAADGSGRGPIPVAPAYSQTAPVAGLN